MNTIMALLFGCGGGGDGVVDGNPDDSTPLAVAGEWEVTRMPDPSTLDSSYDCNIHNQSTSVCTITQNGNEISIVTDITPEPLIGTLEGDRCKVSGHFSDADGDLFIDIDLQFTSDMTLSGSGTTRFEDGTRYCQWNDVYSGSRAVESNCIAVDEGGWEFEWRYNGITVMMFTGGDLRQSGCHLTYDDDNIFSGPLDGALWEGENPVGEFKFSGTFSGSPANSFQGTWTDLSGSGNSGQMYGVKGVLP